MEDAFLGELAAGIIYLLAGARLARLGARTRELPERLLGASFALFGVSEILYAVAVFETLHAYETPIFFVARVAYLPASILIAVFTARVFRSDDARARGFVWLLGGMVTVGVGGSVLEGDWEGFSLTSVGFWSEWIGYTLPFAWAAIEAFRHYVQARRRVSIGLCEPLVCNRFLLWSLFGVIHVISCAIVIGQYAAYERESVFSSTWDLLYAGSTLWALLVMWLAFFPPASYRRWVARAVSQSRP
jgi:hypothetical protein